MKSHRLKPSHNAVSTAMVNHESTIPSEMHVSTESEYRMDEKDSRSKVVYTGLEVLDVHNEYANASSVSSSIVVMQEVKKG